ncbi:hypothetical protein FOCC_FOCC016933 [Frankliniella occidentalis]|nr:hypothetical protein FOCC_FOCC016933 [Frankliniella occidentalis]
MCLAGMKLMSLRCRFYFWRRLRESYPMRVVKDVREQCGISVQDLLVFNRLTWKSYITLQAVYNIVHSDAIGTLIFKSTT